MINMATKTAAKAVAGEVLPVMGRPRLYPDAEAFAAKAEAYFASMPKKPNLNGLCLFMGFCDKESFSNYATYGDDFSRTVKKVQMRIEEDRIERLLDKQGFTPGVIFDLKNNHGWKDQQQLEHSGAVSVQFSTVYERPPG
jgi:hypothetical protein